jgi:xanthine dehydrogenase YagS FAD-binding subunit
MMERTMLLETSYREPGSTPHRETSIDHGDLVVAVSVPPPPGGGRSAYLKVRERASYEFALVSVAASVALHGEVIGEARVALDGVATRPWRAHQTEAMLAGVALDDRAAMREAASAAFAEARPLRDNSFKIDLGTRAIGRALRQASSAVRAFRAWPYWLLAARCR